MATEKERFAELLDRRDFDMVASFKQTYIDALKQYYFVGGMPEVVQSFAENKDFNEARYIQKRILAAYEQDFSKHAPNAIVPKIRMLWNSIPSQLAKENKKFIYGLLREGARAKEYETDDQAADRGAAAAPAGGCRSTLRSESFLDDEPGTESGQLHSGAA